MILYLNISETAVSGQFSILRFALLFPPYYAKISTRETLDVRRSIHLPKVHCTLKGGEAVYITLSDLIQIGIFLTAFTVMIFTIISFYKKK